MADHKQNFKYTLPWHKRLFDFVISGILLLLLLPLCIIITIFIVLESKGSAIYKSERIGSNQKPFILYKFRSMYEHADRDLLKFIALNQYRNDDKPIFIKLENDPRVTKVGRFIRQASLDELPQLFNILKGDMSIVGNRPLQYMESEILSEMGYNIRFHGPTGLTGLWQVSKRGKSAMNGRERIRLDIFYVHNYSFSLDLKIILKTLPTIIQKSSF